MEKIRLSKLQTNNGQIEGLPKNPRFIKDDRFDKLIKSVSDSPEFMNYRPLLVFPFDGKYVCVGGNMRLRACSALKWKEVPCEVLPEDTPIEKLREYAIKDNVAFGNDDWDLLANEWDEQELEDWGVEWKGVEDVNTIYEGEKTAEEDDFDESKDNIESRCKMNDIWKLGEHRLMCGDSTNAYDVAKLMNGKTADLVVTDPPYNVAIKNSRGMTIENDNMEGDKFRKFLTDAFSNMNNSLKDGGVFYIWYASREHRNFENALNDVGLFVREQLIWNKNAFVFGRQDYQWKHEPCLYGWKDGAGHFFIDDRTQATVYEDITIKPEKMKKEQLVEFVKKVISDKVSTTVIDEKKPAVNDLHPTMKPVKLIERLVKNSSRIGEVVLDLFGGSGTTIITCEQIGRKCNTMEYDEHYCDVIIARWEKLTGKQAVKLT